MKKLYLLLIILSIIYSCERNENYEIPEGQILSVKNNGTGGLYTNSNWDHFYIVKDTSYFTKEGLFENKKILIDSFISEVSLTRLEAQKLSVSGDVKIPDVNLSTKQNFPSWRKEILFEEETLQRKNGHVFFTENKEIQTITFLEFAIDSTFIYLLTSIGIVLFIAFAITAYNYDWQDKKKRKTMFFLAISIISIFSCIFLTGDTIFKAEIVISFSIIILLGILLGCLTYLIKEKIKKRRTLKPT